MIIVRITGGIGNQLFQFAFGKNMATNLNTEVKFDIQTKNLYANYTQRSFGLGNYISPNEIASDKEIARFKYFKNSILARFERKFVQVIPFINQRYIIQNLYKSFSNQYYGRDNCYYDGYWQSEKYFKPIESTLRQIIKLNPPLDENNVLLLDKIKSTQSVSLHIRRSDYISNKDNIKIYDQCTLRYYKKAIDIISLKINKPVFYIFSDDIKWIKTNFSGKQFKIVDNNTKDPEIDMYLMSKCKYNIIANSSFSWWAAWLNNYQNKVVIAPKKWFINNMSDIDIIPDNWIKADNN